MGPTCALLAATAFALGTVLQQRGTLGTAAAEGDPRFLAEIVREPVWLVGGALQALGWVLQAVALGHASLVVVQSICALSLVIALPLGVRLTDQAVNRRSLIGAACAVLGIVLFVAVGQPQNGVADPGAAAWWSSAVVTIVAVLALGSAGRRRRGPMAAALLAAAAGFGFAYQAAVTKVFVTELGGGLLSVLTMWSTYALIVSAILGFVLQQSALKTGFLAPAMAASNATTLVISVVLGVTVFEETLTNGGGHLIPGLFGLALATTGVGLLATDTASYARPPAGRPPHII